MDRKRTFRYWQWRIIIISMFVYSIYYFVRKNFSVAMPGLTAEYGISNTDFGIVIAVGSLIYGLSRFINGFIVERYSTKIFMGIGLLLCAISNFCFGFGVDLSYFITGIYEGPQFVNILIFIMSITIILNQYFQGFGYPPCARMLPQWIAPNELATKMSIWNTSHSVGSFCSIVICGFIMTHMGTDMSGNDIIVSRIINNLSLTISNWSQLSSQVQEAKVLSYVVHYGAWKWCFFIPAIIAIVGALICFLTLEDTPQKVGFPEIANTRIGNGNTEISKGVHKEFLRYMVFRNRWIWTLGIANVFIYVLRMGVLDWGPKFLTEYKGMRITDAAWSVGVFEISAIVGTIFAGWAVDHIFNGKFFKVCIYSMGCSVLFLALFALVPMPTLLSIVVLSMSGFFIYGPQALVGIGAANLATKEASATANGLVGILGYLGSALSAIGIGIIADTWGWNWVFITFIIVGIIGTLVFCTMWNAPSDGYNKARNFTEIKKQR